MQEYSTQAKIQKLLVTHNAFKRNRRYYDAPKLIELEKINEIKRRKPHYYEEANIEQQLNKTFFSSKASLTQKVSSDIGKFKQRVSLMSNTAPGSMSSMSFYQQSQSRQQNSQSPPKSPRINGVPHISMTSRDYLYKRQNKPIIDERLFTNFKIQKPSLEQTSDFSKRRGRSLNSTHGHINDLYYDTQRLYQKNNFNRNTESCNFDLKLQKPKGRYFFISRREVDDPATDLNPQRVRESVDATSNFDKFNAKAFYNDSGRQLPSQVEIRKLSPNRDYWRGNQTEVIRPKMDFLHQKLKQEMKVKRMDSLKKRRQNHLDRNQVCDQKYFQMVYPHTGIIQNVKSQQKHMSEIREYWE